MGRQISDIDAAIATARKARGSSNIDYIKDSLTKSIARLEEEKWEAIRGGTEVTDERKIEALEKFVKTYDQWENGQIQHCGKWYDAMIKAREDLKAAMEGENDG